MASFLDKAGLTKFWELIKQYLQENFTPMYEKISLENRVDNIDKNSNFLNTTLIFSSNYLVTDTDIEFSGREKSRLSSLGYLGNIILNLFFERLFYLFDTTTDSEASISVGEILKYMDININHGIYLGRVYRHSNRGINKNLDIYLNEYNGKYNISMIPIQDNVILFSDGKLRLDLLEHYHKGELEIQDPIIPDLTLDKFKDNLSYYVPYLENKSTEIKFKVEYANAIRGLLKIYKEPAGSNRLELIGRDSSEDTNFSKHLTPGEIVTTYLEPGDKLYMYGNLLNISRTNDKIILKNILKLLPHLPNTNTQEDHYEGSYIINITSCNSEGTPLDQIDLDQHYLKYGGDIRGMLGYQSNFLNDENPIFYEPGHRFFNFMSFISGCKYIRDIEYSPLMNKHFYNEYLGLELSNNSMDNIPIYMNAFSNTSIKKGYISLMLYSTGNSSRETVEMFTNFNKTYYNCKDLTELRVVIDWYDDSKVPDYILDNLFIDTRIDNITNKRDKRRELTKKLSETIISNVKGCKNLKKITFQYKVNKPSTNKIQFLLDDIKDYILNSNDTDLKLDHKGTNDNTIDYTIEIEAI